LGKFGADMTCFALILLFPAALYADTSTKSPPPGLGVGWLIAWAICSTRKKQAIGGWLLYYYYQLYMGLLMTMAFFAISVHNYVPEAYDDPKSYALFLLAVLPDIAAFVLQIITGTLLLNAKTPNLLSMHRRVLIFCTAIGVAEIGLSVYRDTVDGDFLSIIGTIQLIIWTLYFYRSQRVKQVFVTHDWETRNLYVAVAATA
jgi:hypothetical protein